MTDRKARADGVAVKCFASSRRDGHVAHRKNPIDVPKGVEVNIASGQISVKGPLGTIVRAADPNVAVETDGARLQCKALGNSRHANAMSGTMRRCREHGRRR